MDRLGSFYAQRITEGGYALGLEGVAVTRVLAICGVLIGIVVGTLCAILFTKEDKNRFERVLEVICKLYVGFFRGPPLVVTL